MPKVTEQNGTEPRSGPPGSVAPASSLPATGFVNDLVDLLGEWGRGGRRNRMVAAGEAES